MHNAILLNKEHRYTMQDDVQKRYPEEACGLLIGKAERVFAVVPVTNVLHSRVRYRMDPHEQLRVFKTLEENDWHLTAIYHSHPDGPDTPSQTDIDECYYPDAVQIIWFKKNNDWQCKGFYIQSGAITDIPIYYGG